MTFDSTTFVLELINFLVLVWILQRLLYGPVATAIARRKAAIEKEMADAQRLHSGAESLKREYEQRLGDWALERETARTQLREELGREHTRLMTALQASLEAERERSRVLEQRRVVEMRRQAQDDGLRKGAQFVARLMSRLACAEVEGKIREAVLEDLSQLSEKELQGLRRRTREGAAEVRIVSRYPKAQEEREALAQALGRIAGRPVACRFAQDPELIAGLRITLGPWVLQANVRDELKFFAEAAHHGGE